MSRACFVLGIWFLFCCGLGAQSLADWSGLKSEFEQAYVDGSYAKALDTLERMKVIRDLPESKADWLTFRMADCRWRIEVARGRDAQVIQKQKAVLTQLAERLKPDDGTRPPTLWAQVMTSLAEQVWEESRNANTVQPYVSQVLDYWAGSTDLDEARDQYLKLVDWMLEWPPYGRTAGFNEVLLNAIQLEQDPVKRAYYEYQLARILANTRSPVSQVRSYYQQALRGAGDASWRPNLIYDYARWEEQFGASYYDENGYYRHKGNLANALELYRSLVREYPKGEVAYWSQAQDAIERIASPQLNVLVSNQFAPGVIPKVSLDVRNLTKVSLTIRPVKLKAFLSLASWVEDSLAAAIGEPLLEGPIYEATIGTTETEPYQPFQQEISLAKPLPVGLYLVEARSGEVTSREMLLVSDVALQYHFSGNRGQGLFWMVSAVDGSPVANAPLTLWQREWNQSDKKWQLATQLKTGDDGLVVWRPTGEGSYNFLLMGMSPGGAPVFIPYVPGFGQASSGWDDWKLYVFTDRPAYRPGDTVYWKVIARSRGKDWTLSLPEETLSWEIIGPRGTVIDQGKAEWNEYGSFDSQLSLKAEYELGVYTIRWRNERNDTISETALFRLEEFRLPEFEVSVSAHRFGSKEESTAFRAGDILEVVVQADYYFGAPVADADVELVIYKSPFYPGWRPLPIYSWLRPALPEVRPSRQMAEKVTLKTDSQGRGTYQMNTDQQGWQNSEYLFEARVTDSSRREVVGQGTVRVTLQPYFAYVYPAQQLYRPGETVLVNVKTLNANDSPVSVEGRLVVTRDRWREIWVGPSGERLSGEEYRERQKTSPRSRSSRNGDLSAYRLEYEVREVEDVDAASLKTNEKGEAVYELKLEKEGLYHFKWVGIVPDSPPVIATGSIWVSSAQSNERAFRGPLKIITDEGAFKVGQQAPVLVTTPTPGRYVLVAAWADNVLEYKVVQIEGTARMIPFAVTRAWIPNVQLNAIMVDDYLQYNDSKEITVLPEDVFLKVEVKPNKDIFLPGQEMEIQLEARDYEGKPVESELAISVVDEAVYAIQPELAPEIEAFFYGQRRQFNTYGGSSLQYRPFLKENNPSKANDMAESIRRRGFSPEGAVDLAQDSSVVSKSQVLAAVAPTAAVAESAAGSFVEVVVRTDFRNTAYWNPSVITDKEGRASVKAHLPESLTAWRVTARGITKDSEVGQADTVVRTQLPLIARLQTTRFLVTGDRAVFSGVFNNNTDQDMLVRVRLDVDGLELADADKQEQEIKVPARGEARLDWQVAARIAGSAKITLKALSGEYSDGMERVIPVIEHGMIKQLATSGRMVEAEETITFVLPPHKEDGLTFEVVATPSLAVTMLDALPYLAEYPYGCTEQTISRFVPAVVVKRTLRELGVDVDTVLKQRFGGISGDPSRPARLTELDAMVEAGLKRLYDFQHSDGAWGWWKEGPANLYMSAYVLWGLTLAEDAGVDVKPDVLRKAREYLADRLVDVETQYDLQAWILFSLASRYMEVPGQPGRFEAKAFANLWRNRDQLNNYTLALLTLSAHYLGFEEEARILVDNLRNGVIINENPQSSVFVPNPAVTGATGTSTAHWGRSGFYWRWSEGGVEATSFAINALLAADPSNDLLQPAVNWLLKNRRGANWSNTKDTAIAILALTNFLRQSKELEAEGAFEILVNDVVVAREQLMKKDSLKAPSRFQVDPKLLREGSNTVTMRRTEGSFGLYYSAAASFFTLENPIEPAGNEVFIRREFFRLVPVPTLLKGYQMKKEPLNDGDAIQSGDRIEVVLTVDAKNDYEFMMIEDWKAAGLEAVELQSGLPLSAWEVRLDGTGDDRYTGRSRWVYQELRDDKVACFINRLSQGYWEIRYELRAESPGKFSALPAVIQAMYIPEIQGNSAEACVLISDKDGIQD